jgi:hypothetical protein|tara:strand:+ start:355 stop:549 length:195 start_codon:yes stop_codon:yes gene_type:complete
VLASWCQPFLSGQAIVFLVDMTVIPQPLAGHMGGGMAELQKTDASTKKTEAWNQPGFGLNTIPD